MEVIEHLYSPRTFAAFVRSILEANGGGRFILTTPYHGYLKNLSIALAGKADRHYSALWEGGHIKFWSRRTLAILLREPGSATWPSPARGASVPVAAHGVQRRSAGGRGSPGLRPGCGTVKTPAVPAGGAIRRQMPPKQRGDGTEAAQGMVRKQYGVRHGSSTETAGRRHGGKTHGLLISRIFFYFC